MAIDPKTLAQGTGVYYVNIDLEYGAVMEKEEKTPLPYGLLRDKVLDGVEVVVRGFNYDCSSEIMYLRLVGVNQNDLEFSSLTQPTLHISIYKNGDWDWWTL